MDNTVCFFLGSAAVTLLSMWAALIYTARRGVPSTRIGLILTIALPLIIFALGMVTDMELQVVIGFSVTAAAIIFVYWIVRPRVIG